MLWMSTYLNLSRGLAAEVAASFAGSFCIGITAGRAISGFVTMKLNDTQMIRLGQGIILAGIIFLLIPVGTVTALIGFALIGLGCAPIYPCIIHSTPVHFGAENSQAVIGFQMAFAYTGTLLTPPLYGLISNYVSPSLLPFYLLFFLAVMVVSHERVNRK